MRLRGILFVVMLFGLGASSARPAESLPALPSPSTLAQGAEHRFPQPVKVGDLVGRKMLAPQESQPVLGRVVDVVRTDAGVQFVVKVFRWPDFEFGERLVAVPSEAVALLGEYVALVGFKPEQLGALPDFDPGSVVSVAADDSIRVGIVGPFH